jgi:hypothetical protein
MKIRPLLLLIISASASTAAPLWDIDFDSMTAGSAPSLQNPALPGVVNTMPTSLNNSDSTNTVLVTSNFSANGKTLTGKSLAFVKSVSGTQEVALIGNSADYSVNTDYQVSFNLLADSRNVGQPFNLRLTTDNTNVSVASLSFDMAGSIILSSNLSSTAAMTLTGAWDVNAINSVVVQIDASTKTVFTLIDGRLVGQMSLDLAGTTNPLGVGRVRFRSNSTNQLYAYGLAVDDIVTSTTLSPIPEPGPLALVALGAIAAGAIRKRHQQLRSL